MAVVNFQDLPSTSTPLSATNLNKIQEGNVYSTSETEVGKWIDGKPIYRRTFEYTTNSVVNAWKTIGTITNIKMPIKMYGVCYNGNAKFHIPYAEPGSSGINAVWLYCDTNSGLFREQHSYTYANSLPAYVTIEYTKTTD